MPLTRRSRLIRRSAGALADTGEVLVLGTGGVLGTVWDGEVRFGAWAAWLHCAGFVPVTVRSVSGLRKRFARLAERTGTLWKRLVG